MVMEVEIYCAQVGGKNNNNYKIKNKHSFCVVQAVKSLKLFGFVSVRFEVDHVDADAC